MEKKKYEVRISKSCKLEYLSFGNCESNMSQGIRIEEALAVARAVKYLLATGAIDKKKYASKLLEMPEKNTAIVEVVKK